MTIIWAQLRLLVNPDTLRLGSEVLSYLSSIGVYVVEADIGRGALC